MSKLATTHLGTSFETHCSHLLRQSLGMSLSRIGGKGDGGVDLRGWWYLPRARPGPRPGTNHEADRPRGRVAHNEGLALKPGMDGHDTSGRRLRVLVQCKAEKIKAGPRLIREMEGIARRGFDLLRNQPSDPIPDSPYNIPEETRSVSDDLQTLDTITTVICTRSGFSPSATLEAVRSRVPMLLLHVPFEIDEAMRLIAWQQRQQELTEEEQGGEDYPIPSILRAAFSNPALAGTSGVLGEDLELRKEYAEGTARAEESFGMGLWWR